MLKLPILPELLEKPIISKRFPKDPDLTVLRSDQLNAFTKIIEFFLSDKKEFLVTGPAGSGKSFLLTLVVEYLIVNFGIKIAVTAPTHKACAVLRNNQDYISDLVEIKTTHSFLGLKEEIDTYGRSKFVPDYGNRSTIDLFDVLIQDECSMSSRDLCSYLNEIGCKRIYFGDQGQIPPIGESLSETFQILDGVHLSQIIRQAKKHPIIKLANNIHINSFNPIPGSNLKNNLGYIYFDDYMENSEYILELIDLFFTSDQYKNDPNFCKIICWRNKIVDRFNQIVRKYIYQEDYLDKVLPGERLITLKPIIQNEKVIIGTNIEFEITTCEVLSEEISPEVVLNYYHCPIVYTDLYGNKQTIDIRIIHEDSEQIYKAALNVLRSMALAAKNPSVYRSSLWAERKKLFNYFAHVTYSHALTVHRSQGSSIEYTFIIKKDIELNRNISEMTKIMYTALTRTKKISYIIN